MSGIPFGWLKKQEPVFIPLVTDEQAAEILEGKGRIYCEAYRCNMKAEHCAMFFEKAKANAKNWKSEVGSTHRAFCLKCEAGRENAARGKTGKALVCKHCGRDLTAGDARKKYDSCSVCRTNAKKWGLK